jgi:hypothetical protein
MQSKEQPEECGGATHGCQEKRRSEPLIVPVAVLIPNRLVGERFEHLSANQSAQNCHERPEKDHEHNQQPSNEPWPARHVPRARHD